MDFACFLIDFRDARDFLLIENPREAHFIHSHERLNLFFRNEAMLFYHERARVIGAIRGVRV
jgi:hypothetical protein